MSLSLILGRCCVPLCQMCCLLGVWDKSYNNFNGQCRQDFVLKNCWGVCVLSVSSGCQAVALAGNSFEVTNRAVHIFCSSNCSTRDFLWCVEIKQCLLMSVRLLETISAKAEAFEINMKPVL